MRFAGRESWQVSHGSSFTMDTALFVRDTLALSVETVPELPGLDPPVPVFVPPGVDRAGAAEEWLGWWADVLDHARGDRSDVPSPADPAARSLAVRPALRGAVEALMTPASQYWTRTSGTGHPTALPVGEVVRGVESRLGRQARPFRLVITVVGVQGLVWERMTDSHVIASRRFLDDPARCAPALRAVVESLA
ncbi:hypothetical protein [Saccharothrix coeruleofusca]|uniref:Uncharacterized protein n=1 Tax=Saccharothrix coeruleofusca TaxID=33919 RepID=A0A918AWE7_9PSEU|nr:hypothetical protein [Saccharothrix coeruleofusca]MBP2339781.1 hypothetical protein [Saccharothrix coeruleofusca]GGP80192.1 hypothetical protein GCM10010185_62520 [Saccharothrix coeruleofusca]